MLTRLLLTLLVAGCAAAPPAPAKSDPAAPTVTYYYGPMVITSPDGSTTYSNHHTLVKREVRPADGLIIEEAYEDRNRDGEPQVMRHVTRLTQLNGTNRFEVSEESGAFTGTVTFTGEAWAWDKWEYDIRLAEGAGSIIGFGGLVGNGIETRKQFNDTGGMPRAVIVARINVISAEQFELRKEYPAPWPKTI